MTGNCVCFYSIVGVPVSQCLQGLLKPLSLEVTAIRRSSRGLKSNPCRGFSLVERIKHWLLIGWDVYSQKRRVIRHSSIRWKPNPCRGLSNYAHTTWEPLSICRFRIGRCPNITKQCWFLSIWRRDLRVVTSGVVIYCKTFEKLKSWSHIYRAQQQHCLVNLVSTLSWTASWSHYSRIGRRQC